MNINCKLSKAFAATRRVSLPRLAIAKTLIAISFASIAAVPPATLAARAEKGNITPAAMTSWKIVCDPAATEAEHYAATEFQRLFNEVSLEKGQQARYAYEVHYLTQAPQITLTPKPETTRPLKP